MTSHASKKPTRTRGRAVCVVVAALLVLAPVALAGVGDYTCSDPSKVYYGNSRLFQRPAGIDCDRVYDRISEYKEIVRRGLTAKDPQYHLLMKKATVRFSEAVKKMAKGNNHDLVAHTGSIRKAKKSARDVPDRTQDVIQKLD